MPRSTRSERANRRRRLLELLTEGFAGTQDEISERLAADGYEVTQATISRDLDDLGAVRERRGQRWVYALPTRNGPPQGFGRRVFSELVRDATPSGTLVVVHTYPGMAPTVGAVLDTSGPAGIVGTVAGDDTVLVVADERVGARSVCDQILALAREDAS